MAELSIALLTKMKRNSLEKHKLQNALKYPNLNDRHYDASYNPNQYPPNLQDAKNHGKAKRVAIPRFLYEELKGKPYPYDAIDACNCCGLEIQNEPLDLSTPYQNLLFLGSGYPLFFQFFFFAIGLQLIIFLFSGVFNIATNLKIDGCANDDIEVYGKKCLPALWNRLSLANKSQTDEFQETQAFLNLLTIIASSIYLSYCRFVQRKTAFKCDTNIVSPSDYSIRVDGLPKDAKISEIKSFFEKSLDSNTNIDSAGIKVNIKKINRAFFISDYVEAFKVKTSLHSSLIFLNHKLKIVESSSSASSSASASIKREIELTKKKLEEKNSEIASFSSLMTTKQMFTGTAFITFDTPKQSRMVKRNFQMNRSASVLLYLKKQAKMESKLLFKNEILKIERAPEPNDIIWENLGYSWSFILKRKVVTSLATFFGLTCSFVGILAVSYFQRFLIAQDDSQNNFLEKMVINSMGAATIVMINHVLNYVIDLFTVMEKHSTYTGYQTALAGKKIIAAFFNTAFIYILISIYFSDLVGRTGLVQNLLYIYINNMIINVMLFIFDPFYLLKLYKQRQFERNLENTFLRQNEANSLFEDNPIQVPYLFSSVVYLVLFTSFYGSLVPMGTIIGIITLIAFYWTYKYVLLRRTSVKNLLGKKIAYEMIEYLEYSPFLFALGDIFFSFLFYRQVSNYNIIACIVAVLNFLLPMKFINKKLFRIKEKSNFYATNTDYTQDYHLARKGFTTEYDRSNPLTQKKATEEWVSYIENLPHVSPTSKNKFINSMDRNGNDSIMEQTNKHPVKSKYPDLSAYSQPKGKRENEYSPPILYQENEMIDIKSEEKNNNIASPNRLFKKKREPSIELRKVGNLEEEEDENDELDQLDESIFQNYVGNLN